MRKIDRTQAEDLILNSPVLNSKINQNKSELCLLFSLANGQFLQMNYKIPEGNKTYFLIETKNDFPDRSN